MRSKLTAQVVARGNELRLSGDPEEVAEAERAFKALLVSIRRGETVSLTELERASVRELTDSTGSEDFDGVSERLPHRARPKTAGQRRYVQAIAQREITFGVGPAGTGKTFLAVAMAVQALKEKKVKRIILTRPAVEAGEKLGFLPGDLQAKIDPYLRPLYDALYDMLEGERVESLLQTGAIEVAPLAFMRGRAQPLSSRVLTPWGWREMQSLEVGDYVIGANGRPTQVLGVYPQGMRPVYRVIISDGSSTLTCAEHLWAVSTPADKRRGKSPRILTTQAMIGSLRSAHQHRYELPLLSAPVQFAPRAVPLEPYALGLLLGDGCLTGSTTPSPEPADPEPVQALASSLPESTLSPKRGVGYALKCAAGGRGGVKTDPVARKLRDLSLQGSGSSTKPNKFVPEEYLYNTAEVRLALLQGLLDTDGSPVIQKGRTCRIQYRTASPQLRDDVLFLVRSLGGVAYWRTRHALVRTPGRARGREAAHPESYILDMRLPSALPPFRLARKAEAYAAYGGGRPMRFISAIEPSGETQTRCIRVAAPDHLYVTDDFILTHNTLNDAFIILDEAQNTTPEQMKMFLTRMGFNGKVVVTGDDTQTDLPGNIKSGLKVAVQILQGIEGISFIYFSDADVVRHPLVARIVKAYERHEG